MYRLIVTAKMNDVDPQVWPALLSIQSNGSTNCFPGIGAAAPGKLIKQREPKLTGTRSSPDAYLSVDHRTTQTTPFQQGPNSAEFA